MIERLLGRKARSVALGVVALAAVFVGSGCSREKQIPQEPPRAPVQIAIAQVEAVPVDIQAIGTVEASVSAMLRPRVTGLVTSVEFAEGQEVKEGDVLFRLDRRPFEVALQEAESNLARSRTEAANAALEAARYNQLYAAGVSSKQEAQRMRSAADAAKAAVASFQAATQARKLDLEYATVRAPITGRTGAILVREGNTVRANETNLVEIRRLSPAFVSFTVPAAELERIQRYASTNTLRVSAKLPGDAGAEETGTLSFLDNTIDRATGTVRLKGTFENPDRRLWPGQFVDVVVTLDVRSDAIVVPAEAIQTGPAGAFVYVIGAGDTAEMRKVLPGIRAPGNRVVVDSGLSAGERVVTDGQLRLVAGTKVAIQNAPGPNAADGGAPP